MHVNKTHAWCLRYDLGGWYVEPIDTDGKNTFSKALCDAEFFATKRRATDSRKSRGLAPVYKPVKVQTV